MRHPEIDWMMVQMRRQDELAAAEHSQLVKTALEAQRENRAVQNGFQAGRILHSALRLAGQGLYQLGLRIESLGCRLQVRYATAGGRAAPCD
jgi:hypothetical protein